MKTGFARSGELMLVNHTVDGGDSAVFMAYRDAHHAQSILVCGCGESLSLLPKNPGVTTIGVNDIGRSFTPTYLVIVNSRSEFETERFHYVETSRAEAIFTQLKKLGVSHPRIVHFRLGVYGGIDFSNPHV